MGLETGSYISDLVATNPVAGDPVSQADDHLRLLKTTILASFPNITGAMTQTHTRLNQLLTLGTSQATTSGTSVDFTSIPTWVRRITVMLNDVSLSGSSSLLIQLGDSGGVEATGYSGSSAGSTNGVAATVETLSTGFKILSSGAGQGVTGQIVLTSLSSANTLWVASGTFGASTGTGTWYVVSGVKSTSAILDRVRLTSVNGTDTLDSGSINILYD